jgi:hypothetical protein
LRAIARVAIAKTWELVLLFPRCKRLRQAEARSGLHLADRSNPRDRPRSGRDQLVGATSTRESKVHPYNELNGLAARRVAARIA